MAGIEVTALHKRYPDGTVAVDHVDLSIGHGELFVMLGPSGCGKTTTLRAIAGLERQTAGDIRIGDTLVNDLPPAERDIAMVFQFYALYPHLRTRDNLAFPLRAEGLPKQEVHARVDEAARLMRLGPLLDRRPRQLSGGEQQRVALARALVRRPRAFLMDEPLTNLDAELRADMRTEIKHLQGELGATMVYVTHDQVEAMSLGHRIAILNKGRVEQIGTPLEVYDRPASLFCAAFIGSPPMNLIEVEVADGKLRSQGGLVLTPPPGLSRDRSLVAGVRPEALEVTESGAEGSIPARVVSAEWLGDEIIYVVDHSGQRDVRVRMPPTVRFAADATVGLRHTGGTPAVYDVSTEELVA
ncbi:sn-glycerol 3-phosphate transport system ATP-binding protein/multiple sugar transport system ATP-binding protein [Micromonospora luteifusca]|uniref:Sn-glycerol 3-phosphate transport system ATP-binding protein/multiple sugar transport system ATP-binding protein n=1 Tax=Micromonospora luteifusca TaxID=709860 RepID=A0ABS2LMV8_9ACTN|nr:ATP-binding cassette domain-containing protein [Micromonospora luteifusca]MBM7489527.1 sn-glycerol 3-phosphate transport system ATP-binding protein/multiple sugar transport system ATP-binding protein [Micromonospora luteifusca]